MQPHGQARETSTYRPIAPPTGQDGVGVVWAMASTPGPSSSSALRARLAVVAPVGTGLIVLGISAYAFLGFAGHALAPREYAAVASLYLLTAVVGPGVFVAVEQETSREVSSRISTNRPTRPVVRSATVISGVLAAAVIVLLLALSPLLVYRVFGGAWSLLVAALVGVAGAASVYVIRGVFSGQRQYG